MSLRSSRGATLVVGLILLALVTLLGLAGASAAHVEHRLAQDDLFRENAASAASAGIEFAIGRIVTSSLPASAHHAAVLPGGRERFETSTRFVGFELALPQEAGGSLVGAHFEILSTGFGARRAVDRQRADVMWVLAGDARPLPCEPGLAATPCRRAGELLRLGWHRVEVE